MIVIIPCGAKKLTRAAPAQAMYIVAYHRMCQRYARSLVAPEHIFILSAKYGLLRLQTVIMPYSLTLGEPGCVTLESVHNQARQLGILTAEHVIALGGKRYVDLCRAIWPTAETPLQTFVKGGNGKQMQWMRRQL